MTLLQILVSKFVYVKKRKRDRNRKLMVQRLGLDIIINWCNICRVKAVTRKKGQDKQTEHK